MHRLRNQEEWKLQYSLYFIPIDHLIICSLNTRSLPLHAEDIVCDHDLLKATVLCLQETRDKTHAHLHLLAETYNCYPSLAIHGILTCCAKTTTILKTNSFATKFIESITIDILHFAHTLRIENVYITQDAPINDISSLISNIFTSLPADCKVIITGDFNIDMLNFTKRQNACRSDVTIQLVFVE
jgi:hypothetical protein